MELNKLVFLGGAFTGESRSGARERRSSGRNHIGRSSLAYERERCSCPNRPAARGCANAAVDWSSIQIIFEFKQINQSIKSNQ